ncbi:hypothetical protein PENSPDRAFT_659290 [Peniophora sp. CONT]|nr:hypothetical protein PENSPDRAFT_659290 [Peniophora sp. CONT]
MDLTKRLPPELMSHIFILVQADSPILRPAVTRPSLSDAWSPRVPITVINNNPAERRDSYARSINRRAMAWVRLITHVCGRWRSIALSTQSLWARPTIYIGLAWFEEMIRRSGNAMLSLSGRECGFHSGETAVRAYMAEVLQDITQVHARRIRSLKFENSFGLPFLLKPFQRIENFELNSVAVDLDDWGMPPGMIEIFSGHAPSLQSLSLRIQAMRYSQLPDRSSIWDTLQHVNLSLSGPLLEAGSDSPILLALSHAHVLRTCTLKASCENPHQDGQGSVWECDTCPQPVVLPDTMIHFEVRGCAHMFAHFLAHVRFHSMTHSTTNIHVHSTCLRLEEAPALPYLRRALALDHRRGPSARALAIIEDPGGNDRAELCLSSSPEALLLHHRLRDGVDDARSYNDIQLLLELDSAHICKLLPYLSNTLILTISRWRSSPRQMQGPSLLAWTNILIFDHVRHLNLSCANLRALVPLLDIQETGELPRTVTLPSLTSLSIGGHDVWDFISTPPGFNETTAVCLRRALRSRATAGKPIGSVFIHIKEELEEARAGNWDRTSCSKYLKNVATIVREGLEELFAIDGLRVVSYNSVYVLNEDGLTGRLIERSV